MARQQTSEAANLTGRVAAITGAARGIGRATAEAFVRQGMKVAIGDLDVEEARRTADQLGAGTIALELNVTDRSSIERFLDEAEARLGPVDVLVNNAGIMQLGRFWEEDDATAVRMVDINLHGVVFGMKAALQRMMPRNRGAIVNIASQAGLYGAPGGATYSATKHGVVGLSEAVRGELRLAGADIQISYVCPVVVNTELGAGTADTKGVTKVQPQDVADAIVDALRNGVVDVHVPKSVKAVGHVTRLLPRPARETVARAMKADRVLFEADPAARQGYELRAATCDPGLETADEPKQLTTG
jgi:NADP-dependent 3-hydroxy acid dehydrogenase YdfG